METFNLSPRTLLGLFLDQCLLLQIIFNSTFLWDLPLRISMLTKQLSRFHMHLKIACCVWQFVTKGRNKKPK